MSYVDPFADTPAPTVAGGQALQNASAQLDLVQRQRALSALHGINVGDQASVQRGINALTGLGMTDQAKALTDLEQQRALNVASRPVALGSIGLAQDEINAERQQGAGSSDQEQQQQFDAHTKQMYQDGADAVNDVLSYDDPGLRDAAAAVQRQRLEAKYPSAKANIDEIFSDTSPDALQKHETFLTGAANGQTDMEHPTGFAASRALLNSDPTYQSAEGVLSHWTAHPLARAALAKFGGLDISPGIQTAENITNPGRAAAATAALAGPTASASAQGTAIGGGSVGSPPVPGARLTFDAQGRPDAWILPDGTTQAIQSAAGAQAAGGAPYQDVTVPTGVPGQAKVESRAQFAGQPPAVGATAAQVTGAQGGAQANVAAANNFETVGAGAVTRKGNLDNLRQEAGEFTAGPQSRFWEGLGALAAEYKIAAPGPVPKDDAVAAQTEFNKVATTILGQQRAALGLPSTDQSTSITQSATPNDTLTAKGIARVTGILEGNEDYLNAGYQAWTKWKNSGHGYETFQQFLPQWNQMFNPRIFQAQYMDPAEAAKVRKTVPNYDAQVKVAKRLGYLGGQ